MRGENGAVCAKVFEKWNIKRIISLSLSFSLSNTINTSIRPGKSAFSQGSFEKLESRRVERYTVKISYESIRSLSTVEQTIDPILR